MWSNVYICVTRFKYLGILVTNTGSPAEWARQVKSRANALLRAYYRELTSFNLSVKLRLDLLNTLVISLCRFGEEIIPDDIARSLSSVHSKGVRLILGQKAIYHPRNDLCRAVIGAKSPVLTAKTGRLMNYGDCYSDRDCN